MEQESGIYRILWYALLLLCLGWYSKYYWTRRRLNKMALKIHGPTPLPIIGNALYFAEPNTEILQKLLRTMKSYKSPMRMWFGQQLAVFVWHPRDLEIVLNSPHALDKERMIYRHYEFALGHGLGTAPAKLWKRNRRLIAPTFKQRNINGFITVFVEESQILVEQFKKKVGTGMFDCFPFLNQCTMDMICETAIGVNIHAQTTDSQVIKWIDESLDIISEKIARIWYHIDFIFERSPMGKELERNFGQFRQFIDEIINKWRNASEQETMEDSNEMDKPKTFLQQLLKLSEDGVSFTNKELRDEVMTFILAGSETTASTLGFALLSLGTFPEIQENVYQELMQVVGTNRSIECQDLPQLQYMDKVLKETMRLFPVGQTVGRSAAEDIKLETCTIPAGSTIAIGLIGLHRDSEIWPNPLDFNPDRFDPEEIAKRHPYSWLPFSGGARNCIGIKYAWMSMKTVLATLLKEYKITTKYKSIEDIHLKHNITLRPVDGYNIAIELRN